MAKKKPASAPELPAAPPLRLEWRDPAELAGNPANWRRHPEGQRLALSAALREVGWAGALLYNEATGRLIDGHLRKDVAEGPVPVLVGSWTEEQERLILVTLDPLASMAEADREALATLLSAVKTEDAGLAALLAGLADDPVPAGPTGSTAPDPPGDFAAYDETIPAEHTCPRCGYRFSGGDAAGEEAPG